MLSGYHWYNLKFLWDDFWILVILYCIFWTIRYIYQRIPFRLLFNWVKNIWGKI